MRSIPLALAALLSARSAVAADPVTPPILVGLNAEFSRPDSTGEDAIRAGILIAIDEINAAGGILGGRRLALLEKDNRSVPARAVENTIAFASNPNVVAVFCGHMSSAVLPTIDLIHSSRLPLLDPWAAADRLVDNGYSPNYVFRLSLRDGWAAPALLRHAQGRGLWRIGLLVANVEWGRANAELLERLAPSRGLRVTGIERADYGDGSIFPRYLTLLATKPDAIIVVTSAAETAELVRGVVALSPERRLPLLSHWSITGSDFPGMIGPSLANVDLSVVQTWSPEAARGKRAERVLEAARRLLASESTRPIVSAHGLAHAYDLTHLLARAIAKAGTTERAAVRDALERLGPYDGLVRSFPQPFTAERHEALSPSDVFLARYGRDGALHPIR